MFMELFLSFPIYVTSFICQDTLSRQKPIRIGEKGVILMEDT